MNNESKMALLDLTSAMRRRGVSTLHAVERDIKGLGVFNFRRVTWSEIFQPPVGKTPTLSDGDDQNSRENRGLSTGSCLAFATGANGWYRNRARRPRIPERASPMTIAVAERPRQLGDKCGPSTARIAPLRASPVLREQTVLHSGLLPRVTSFSVFIAFAAIVVAAVGYWRVHQDARGVALSPSRKGTRP